MARHRNRSSAPLGVKIMAFLVALDGVISIVSGLGLLGGALPLGLLLLGLGAVHIVVGLGIWELEPYAYTWGMGVFALGAVVDLFAGNLQGAGLSVVNVIVLYHYRGLFRD